MCITTHSVVSDTLTTVLTERPSHFIFLDSQVLITFNFTIVLISLLNKIWKLKLYCGFMVELSESCFYFLLRVISIRRRSVCILTTYIIILVSDGRNHYTSKPVGGFIVAVNWEWFSGGWSNRRQTVVVKWQTYLWSGASMVLERQKLV